MTGYIDAPTFRAGMRHLAGACSVIASCSLGRRAGLTATAVCSVSAEPAQLLVCVNRSVRAHEIIAHSGLLSVNVLSEAQESIAKRFAGMVIDVAGEDRFSNGGWHDGKLGIPMLDGSLVSFGCRVKDLIPAATHTVFLCEVVEVVVPAEDGKPLLYFGGSFARIV
ncbi:flavin reductase family protein [Cupriavidus necator]